LVPLSFCIDACHGISRLPEVLGDKEPKRKFKTYPLRSKQPLSCSSPRQWLM